jgi:hypothetical protein
VRYIDFARDSEWVTPDSRSPTGVEPIVTFIVNTETQTDDPPIRYI